MIPRQATIPWLIAGFIFILLAAIFMASHTGTNFFAHSVLDSYSLQAIAWRNGRTSLDQDYPWLELAIYKGDYYVSFPPVPTLPMLLMTFFFGAETPNAFASLLYFLSAYLVAFFLLRRMMCPMYAAVISAFALLGGSVLDLAVSGFGMAGAVWYQAQLLALLLTLSAFLCMERDNRNSRSASLILIALAIGCRPFNALYVPWLLYRLYQKTGADKPLNRLRAMIPHVVIPALIAALYGAYNFARFGNPLEFGHSYLPEFVESGEPMFGIAYIAQNIRQVMTLPTLQAGSLTFPIIAGFAFYLTNPLLVFGAGRFVKRVLCGQTEPADIALAVSLLIHCILLSSHRTNGGWQYGTRYLVDTLPVALYLYANKRIRPSAPEMLSMGALIVFNVYGSIVFHYL